MENLAVIMPVYNEEDAIETVINKWCSELDKLGINYKIFAYNDGSKDNTADFLKKIADDKSNVVVINKKNSGHGSSILKGYKDNAPNFTWLFQIDSDNEMEPESFPQLWGKRLDYDFLIGIRDGRSQNFSRKIISFISRLCVRIFYGAGPWDVNCPYRLMRAEKFIDLFNNLPENTFAPNIIISGIVAKKKLKFFECYVSCAQRQTGEVSIKQLKLLKAAIKSFWQTIIFSFYKT